MKKGWLFITILLALFATYTLANSIYWIIIGYSTQYGSEFVVGTFIGPILLYILTIATFRRAKEEEH